MMNRLAIVSLLCTLPLTACLDEAGDADLEEENTSATVSALCTDGAADAVVAFVDKGGESTAVSPGLSSGYDRAACADHFSVEVTGVSGATQPFKVVGGWGQALPNTAEACPMALAAVQAQEYRWTLSCSGTLCVPVYKWFNVGSEVTLHGVWYSGTFGGCELVPESPLPTFQPSTLRSKVRVSVRALAWAVFFPAYKKAEAGVFSAPIPE
jgi:hypothetical protein